LNDDISEVVTSNLVKAVENEQHAPIVGEPMNILNGNGSAA